PPLVLDANLVATGSGLTIARRRASLFQPPIQVSFGPDTMFAPALLDLTLSGNDIGVKTAALAIDNLDSAGGVKNLQLAGNCYTAGGQPCLAGSGGPPVLGAAAADPTVLAANALAKSLASPSWVPIPEPAAWQGQLAGVAALAVLAALRERRARR